MSKRIFDFLAALATLLGLSWLLVLVCVIAAAATRSGGLFLQKRIGRYGKPFTIYKFRTINKKNKINTVSNFLRESKLDELPQLWNVIKGDMSIVGPRPDIPGYYDILEEPYKKILMLRPGITGPASLKYANEEELLSQQADSQKYNDEVIFPDKVRINLTYYKKQNFWLDLKIILFTLLGKRDIRL